MARHRILIVDDNPMNIELLQEILEDDYDVEIATCGEEALAMVTACKPALILLDIMMPGINGYETCQQLRQRPTLHHLPILMMSAKAAAAEQQQGYDSGTDAYITKPFDINDLLNTIRSYLPMSGG